MRSYKPRVVGTNLQGYAVGQDNPAARHSDAVVAAARAMRAAGMTEAAIARATGVRACTIGRWLRGERRATPPARFIARPAVPKAFTLDREQEPAEPAAARVHDLCGSTATAKLTVKEQP